MHVWWTQRPNLMHEVWNCLSWILPWKMVLIPAYRWKILIQSLIIFHVVNINSVTSSLIFVERWITHLSRWRLSMSWLSCLFHQTHHQFAWRWVIDLLKPCVVFRGGLLLLWGRFLTEDKKGLLYAFGISVRLVVKLGTLRGIMVF